MSTYTWVGNASAGSTSDLGGALPPWWSDDNLPLHAVSTPSPSGPGDILHRIEFAAFVGVVATAEGNRQFATAATHFEFAGEVGTSSSTPPNPEMAGPGRLALVANADMDLGSNVAFGVGALDTTMLRFSTRGYVTSKAIRSPAQYGSIHPSLNVACLVRNGLYIDEITSDRQIWWSFILRTLWLVP